MGEVEALYKLWLTGRGGGRGETPDYGVIVYGDRDERESYSMPTYRNGDNTPQTGT